jgi:putative lipase involved disintegration of autophagic bodies
MNISLIAYIQDHGTAGWIGWIDGLRGMVVQGKDEEEVRNELIISLKTSIAYSWGLKSLDTLQNQKINDDLEMVVLPIPSRPVKKREINLVIAD